MNKIKINKTTVALLSLGIVLLAMPIIVMKAKEPEEPCVKYALPAKREARIHTLNDKIDQLDLRRRLAVDEQRRLSAEVKGSSISKVGEDQRNIELKIKNIELKIRRAKSQGDTGELKNLQVERNKLGTDRNNLRTLKNKLNRSNRLTSNISRIDEQIKPLQGELATLKACSGEPTDTSPPAEKTTPTQTTAGGGSATGQSASIPAVKITNASVTSSAGAKGTKSEAITIKPGESITIKWTSENSIGCRAYFAEAKGTKWQLGGQSDSKTFETSPDLKSGTYGWGLRCFAKGQDTAMKDSNSTPKGSQRDGGDVKVRADKCEVEASASPVSIRPGDSEVISWTSSGCQACRILFEGAAEDEMILNAPPNDAMNFSTSSSVTKPGSYKWEVRCFTKNELTSKGETPRSTSKGTKKSGTIKVASSTEEVKREEPIKLKLIGPASLPQGEQLEISWKGDETMKCRVYFEGASGDKTVFDRSVATETYSSYSFDTKSGTKKVAAGRYQYAIRCFTKQELDREKDAMTNLNTSLGTRISKEVNIYSPGTINVECRCQTGGDKKDGWILRKAAETASCKRIGAVEACDGVLSHGMCLENNPWRGGKEDAKCEGNYF